MGLNFRIAFSRRADTPAPGRCLRCIDISVSAYQAEMLRTTITLDDDIYEACMHLSRVSGERLGKILSTLARRGLRTTDALPRRSKHRFPVFDVPANAPVIPASRIRRVLNEEDIF